MSKQYIVLGHKAGVFKDSSGKDVPFYQLALDCGNYLKVFKVRSQQSDQLADLEVGTVLSDEDLILADKIAVLI